MAVDAVLFDLDGTLVDTLADICSVTNELLAERGFATHPLESYRLFVGSGARELAERALPAESKEEVVDSVTTELQKRLADTPTTKTRPYEGVPELLDALRSTYRLGVLSNKPHEAVLATVRRHLDYTVFDVIMGHRPPFAPKPDPGGAHAVMARMGSPQTVVYVGDSDVDMETATRANMLSVGAAWGFRGKEELERAGARIVIEKPLELQGVLTELSRREENR